MKITKADLDKVLNDVKSLNTRTSDAENRVKELETEKANWLANRGTGGTSNSDEQRALRAFGKSHAKDLIHVNVADPRYKGVPDDVKYAVINLKRTIDVARMTSQMFNGDPSDSRSEQNDRLSAVKGITETRFGKEVLVPMVKAFGTGVAGAGLEWMHTQVSTNYLEEWELARVLESRFDAITMPSNPFVLTKLKNVTKARIATEGQTNFAGSNYGTDKINMSAVKLQEFYPMPEEVDEDSAPDFLSAARDEVIKAQERAAESAIISGDSDGTHIDSDTQAGGADLAEKAWDGLRKIALANSANGVTLDFANAAATSALLGTLRGRMGKFGSDPSNLLILAGPIVYQQLVNMDEVLTSEKFGSFATILKGALAAWQSIPIINTEWFREDLNATGVYDGVTETRAGIIMVNTKRHYVGNRRPIRVVMVPDLPGSDRMLVASYRRVAFASHAQNAVEKSVAYGYNLAK